MLKLLFICNEYPPSQSGGIGTFTQNLAESLVARGHTVLILGLYRDAMGGKAEVCNGVEVIRLHQCCGAGACLRNRWTLYQNARKLALRYGIDLIESADFEGWTAGWPRISEVRVIRLHGSHSYFSDELGLPPSRSLRFLELAALRGADAIVSVSSYTASRTMELFALNAVPAVIHNAVPEPALAFSKRDYSLRRKVAFFGTVSPKKGAFALAEAWRLFHRDHKNWQLTVIGKDSTWKGGSCIETMKELLQEAAPSVLFQGHLQMHILLPLLPTFDFVVLPSYSEAFALAPLEAMAMAVPVIFTCLSSGPELIRDGIDGLLCDPRDVISVAEVMSRCAGNAVLRESIGKGGQLRARDKFSYQRFVESNIAFYEDQLLGVHELRHPSAGAAR